MSERGSYVTEFFYCTNCYNAALKVFDQKHKYLCVLSNNSNIPIIAGRIGGTSIGEELQIFERDIAVELEAVICHPTTVAVISDSDGARIFHLKPKNPASCAN